MRFIWIWRQNRSAAGHQDTRIHIHKTSHQQLTHTNIPEENKWPALQPPDGAIHQQNWPSWHTSECLPWTASDRPDTSTSAPRRPSPRLPGYASVLPASPPQTSLTPPPCSGSGCALVSTRVPHKHCYCEKVCLLYMLLFFFSDALHHLNERAERSDSWPGGKFGPIRNLARLQQELRTSEVIGLVQNPAVNQHKHTSHTCADAHTLDWFTPAGLFGVCGHRRLNLTAFSGQNAPSWKDFAAYGKTVCSERSCAPDLMSRPHVYTTEHVAVHSGYDRCISPEHFTRLCWTLHSSKMFPLHE